MKPTSASSPLGLAGTIARWIILRTRPQFQGTGAYTGEALARKDPPNPFPQAEREASQAEHFFGFFPGHPVKEALRGKDVLDFGCGYGGRTVEYKQMGAQRVCGIEPHRNMVDLCQKYLESRGGGARR